MEVFEFVPRYEYQTVSGYRVLVSQFESGKEQRRYKRRLPREWRLGFADAAEKILELKDFFNRHKGAYASFLWQPPGESQYLTCRFGQDSMEISWQGEVLGECQLTIREIIS